jgi:hypothetical protein
MAFYLAAASKKGFSAHQLHRALGCEYNTAWFLHHRVMEAMRRGGLDLPPLGGEGQTVEIDETYYGKTEGPTRYSRPRARKNWKPTKSGKSGPAGKRPILALVERGGSIRTFHVPFADKENVTRIVRENVARETRLHTDESRLYWGAFGDFEGHETVRHASGEYVRGDVHTNTVEGYFGIFKRGMRGVYHHCKEKHLHRYLAEFDFRYSNRHLTDEERTVLAIRGGEGKRLTYNQPLEADVPF